VQAAQRVLLAAPSPPAPSPPAPSPPAPSPPAPSSAAGLAAWLHAAAEAVADVMDADRAHAFAAPTHGGPPTQAGAALDPAFHVHAQAFFAEVRGADGPDADAALHARMQRARLAGGAGVYHELALAERRELQASPFFQEVCAPHGVRYTTGLSVPWRGGEAAVCVAFDRADAHGYDPAADAPLRLLVPAFEAGLAHRARLAAAHGRLGATLDALPDAVALFDADGAERYRNRALRTLLDAEPEAEALMRAAATLARTATPGASGGAAAAAPGAALVAAQRVVEGAVDAYRLRVGLAPASAGLGTADPGVLVSIDRRSPLPSPAAAQQRHGLTPREAEVALHVARGATNADLAARLHISPHTARHHVAAVLRKLAVASRAAVAHALLLGRRDDA
jgi:DNA-binding CsgD family transcriptional regulator/PAS domain-containing protein